MKVYVVLVRTLYSSNIGSAARALANMGGEGLILIDPQCEVNSKTRQAAAGAQEWLARRRTYKAWDEFYSHEGEGLRIGLTRRPGKTRKLHSMKEVISLAEQSENFKQRPHLYLFFGPEDSGLSSDDLAWMNFNCELPVYGEFQSLNLSQAVLLTLYIVQDAFKEFTPAKESVIHSEPSPTYFPDNSIKRWLLAMGFDLEARKSSAYLTLRRLFLQNNPTPHEVEVLEAVLQQNIRKLEEYNKNRSD